MDMDRDKNKDILEDILKHLTGVILLNRRLIIL
jgi:hypothetical protein